MEKTILDYLVLIKKKIVADCDFCHSLMRNDLLCERQCREAGLFRIKSAAG